MEHDANRGAAQIVSGSPAAARRVVIP